MLGLVNRVVDDALATAKELAGSIVKNAPVALGLAKEAIVRGADVTLPQGLEIEADLFGMVTATEDAKEGHASVFGQAGGRVSGKVVARRREPLLL